MLDVFYHNENVLIKKTKIPDELINNSAQLQNKHQLIKEKSIIPQNQLQSKIENKKT